MARLEDLPVAKECRRCGRVRPKAEYNTFRLVLKNGDESYYLRSNCRACETDLRAERYYRGRRKLPRQEEKRTELLMDGGPIIEWLKENELPVYIDYNIRKRFNDLVEGKAQRISLDTVDRFLVQLDMPELLNEWYPLEGAA